MAESILFEKYGFLTNGLNRQYFSCVTERKYNFEKTVPNQLVIVVPNEWDDSGVKQKGVSPHMFATNSWLRLIESLVNYLQAKAPKQKEELLIFRTDWSRASIFSETKTINNMIKVCDLFMNVNYI